MFKRTNLEIVIFFSSDVSLWRLLIFVSLFVELIYPGLLSHLANSKRFIIFYI